MVEIIIAAVVAIVVGFLIGYFLMQKVLGFTTKKVRSVKHEEWGILLNGRRVTVRARGKEGQLLKVMLEDSQCQRRSQTSWSRIGNGNRRRKSRTKLHLQR